MAHERRHDRSAADRGGLAEEFAADITAFDPVRRLGRTHRLIADEPSSYRADWIVERIPLPVARSLSRALEPVHPGISQMLQLAAVTERDGEPALDGSQPDVEISPTSLEDWLDHHAEREP